MENLYDIQTDAFKRILESEELADKAISKYSLQSDGWHRAWDKLDRIRTRKRSYIKKYLQSKAMKKISPVIDNTLIYSDSFSNIKSYPVGYLSGYELHYLDCLLIYANDNLLDKEELRELEHMLYRKRFQFGFGMVKKFGHTMTKDAFFRERHDFVVRWCDEYRKRKVAYRNLPKIQPEFDF